MRRKRTARNLLLAAGFFAIALFLCGGMLWEKSHA